MCRLRRFHIPRQAALLAVACVLAAAVLLLQLHVYLDGKCDCQRLTTLRGTATFRPAEWKLEQPNGLSEREAYKTPLTAFKSGSIRFPKLIHQTVKNKTRLSCQQRKVIASWRALNPGYSHRLWDDAEIQQFIQQNYPELVPTPINDFVNGAERSDLWRVLVLHKLGGVYADMDLQCLKPIDEWNADHDHDAAVLLGVENYEAGRQHPLHVVNWVLAAAPGHPLLGSMPGIVARAVQQEFFKLARSPGAVLHGEAYTDGIIDRTGPAALSWAAYEFLNNTAGVDMGAVTYSNVTSPAGLLAGGVRLLPIDYMGAGWEVALARQKGGNYTCDDLARDKPDALVCHMFWGSWRDSWGFGQQQTYDDEC